MSPRGRSPLQDVTPDFELDTVAAQAARARTMGALFGADASVPRVIGGYTIRDILGRGAMGVVYLAHDERLDRSVALKLLDPDRRHDPKARASLVEEAKQIAKVQHPNVVAVYEVGSHQGDTFLAMEYVAGPTLREWTFAQGHTAQQILQVYADAGRGLAAVHEAGLLHRDFKPSNVLVTANGIAKVADFGLARIVRDDPPSTPEAQSGPAEPTATQDSSFAIAGTPAYMAPEQFHGVTTARSDQFSFGVALIEALTGVPPFDREPAFKLDAEGAQRRLDGLDRTRLPGWLFAVLRRAVAWDPEARWPDVTALVAALEDDPRRRRRPWVAAVGAVAAAGLAGAAWYSAYGGERCTGARAQLAELWGDVRRTEVRDAFLAADATYAENAWSRTAAELDDYANEWETMHTEACEATTVRGEQSAEIMDLRMACLQRAKMKLGAVTGVLADADVDVVARAHEVVAGLRPLSRCADVTSLQEEVEPPLPEEADAVDKVRRHLAEAAAQSSAGRVTAAQAALQMARDTAIGVEYGPAHTELKLKHAQLLEHVGKYEEAEAVLREALELASRARQWDELCEALTQLIFVVGNRLQRPEDGLRYRETAAGLAHGDPRRQANLDTHVALLLHAQGQYVEAEQANRRALAAFEKAFGPEHLTVATARNNLAAVLSALGKQDQAEQETRRALTSREKALGADHPDALQSRNNLALVLMVRGRYEEAEAENRRVLSRLQRIYGLSNLRVAASHNNIGLVLHQRGRFEDAEKEHRRGLAIREQLLGAEHPSVAESRTNLAAVLVERGAYQEAVEESRRALAIWEDALGSSHPNVAAARHTIATALAGLGELAAAEAEHRRALALRTKALGKDHVDVAQSLADLAAVVLESGDAEEAVGLAERAWTRLERDDVLPQQQSHGAFVYARAMWAARTDPAQRERATALAERALVAHETAGTKHSDAAVEIRNWLNCHRAPNVP